MSQIISSLSSKPLLSSRKIHRRVLELGKEISQFYAGRPVTVLAVLDGAFCFVADLVRVINNNELSLHFVKVSSYGGQTKSSGSVTLDKIPDLSGQSVLIVDDILDSGLTLQAIKNVLNADSVHTCVLLNKPLRRVPQGLPCADFIGFTVPDVFVVGYGLDHGGKYRHLPDVWELRE
jgi:hypoxanthine phosphoribosyltransferase